MDSEQTILDREDSTTIDKQEVVEQSKENDKQTREGKKDSPIWHTVIIGGVTGIVFGAVTTGLRANPMPDNPEQPDGNHNDEPGPIAPHPQPEAESSVTEATSVDDGMSFSEAFASARAEVGPGGVFEWRGNIYGTYYATEWDKMTAEEKDDYSNRVNQRQDIPSESGHSPAAAAEEEEEVEVLASAAEAQPANDDEVEVIGASLADTGEDIVQETEDEDAEVEILGVQHDDESGMNVAYINIVGEDVVLIDTTEDEQFDYMAADLNHDEQITPDEVVDISEYNLSVDDLGGFTDISSDDDLLADAGLC